MSKTHRSDPGHDDHQEDQIAPAVARQIDDNLRLFFDQAASEELPAELTRLLNALRQQDSDTRAG